MGIFHSRYLRQFVGLPSQISMATVLTSGTTAGNFNIVLSRVDSRILQDPRRLLVWFGVKYVHVLLIVEEMTHLKI